jgi:hypothetical protein
LPGERGQRQGHLAVQVLGLLEEVPRRPAVDQHGRGGQQHRGVRPELVVGRVPLARAGQRLRYRPRRAVGLGHHDRRLDGHGAGPGADLPEPDHLVDHEGRDQQHQQPRDGRRGQGVVDPPPPQAAIGDVEDHQEARHQRDGGRGEPVFPA